MTELRNSIEGEKIHCIFRRMSKPRLIHYTSGHRAQDMYITGLPAVCTVIKAWRAKK